MKRVLNLFATWMLAAFPVASGATTAAAPFTDHMVLQRGFPDPVWGTGAAGESVTVSLNGQSRATVAGADGKWSVSLSPLPAGGPYTLTIAGRETLTLHDVMVGEVWVASGQSNMARPLGGGDTANQATFPGFRYLASGGAWQTMTPAVAAGMSATAFYFGRDLHQALGVTVGIMVGAQGSTYIQRWFDPKVSPADSAMVKGGDLFASYIGAWLPYGIKGAIWYQGESDSRAGYAEVYGQRLQALIKFWRKSFAQPEMPFLTVQLPQFHALQGTVSEGDTSYWAIVRDAQRKSLALPNTGMTVNTDIGDPNNIHPGNKSPFGFRLASAARALYYGEKGLAYMGPLFSGWSYGTGGTLRLRFTHADGGLIAKGGGPLKGFAVAGADGRWSFADAVVDGADIVVSSAAVAKPVQARYAWADNPIGNLTNGSGLPASPFLTGPDATVPIALPRSGPASLHRPVAEALRSDALGRRLPLGMRPAGKVWGRSP